MSILLKISKDMSNEENPILYINFKKYDGAQSKVSTRIPIKNKKIDIYCNYEYPAKYMSYPEFERRSKNIIDIKNKYWSMGTNLVTDYDFSEQSNLQIIKLWINEDNLYFLFWVVGESHSKTFFVSDLSCLTFSKHGKVIGNDQLIYTLFNYVQ